MQNKKYGPIVKLAGEDFALSILLLTAGTVVFLYYQSFTDSSPLITSLASFFGWSIPIVIGSFILLMTGCIQVGPRRMSNIKISKRLMLPFLALVGGCLVLSIVFGVLGW